MSTRRRKRFSREARLHSAKKWIAGYSGRDLVRGYRKWFAVSGVCAVVELRMLGVDIPDWQLEEAHRAERDRAALRAARRGREADLAADADGEFAFVAGFTAGGAAFGITWDEMERHVIKGEEEDGGTPWD
jgi:hypothetical protein